MRFPAILNCEGAPFSPAWSELHGLLSDVPSAQATSLSRSLIDRWRNRSSHGCAALPRVLLGDLPVAALGRFCVYGFAAALHHAYDETGEEDLAGAASACLAAGGWWPWNFLSESRWSSVVMPGELLEYHGGVASRGTRRPRVWRRRRSLQHSEVSENSDKYLEEYRRQLGAAMAVTLPGVRPQAGVPAHVADRAAARPRPVLKLAAFGVHLSTLLEPVFALRQVLSAALPIMTVFYGSTHPPPEHILQETCPGDATITCYLSTSPGDPWWQALVDTPSIQDALGELAWILASDGFVSTADCLVCGGGHAPALCLLLRMVTDKPILFTLQAPIAFRLPQGKDQRALLVAFWRELVRPSASHEVPGRTVVSTSLLYLQRQVWVQSGRLLPVVRNHNWYAAMVPDSSLSVARKDEVLFWQNHVSLTPECSITVWRFVKQMVPADLAFKLVFKNVANLPTVRPGRMVYSLGAKESQVLSYAELRRRFAAAVLFPHDVGMISFDDLYALGIPLFLPEDELVAAMALSQLVSTKNYPWYLLREEHADLHFARSDSSIGTLLPWDPGWDGREALGNSSSVYLGRGHGSMEPLRLAIATANFARTPYVRRFPSLAALLDELVRLSNAPAGEDPLAETSEAMKRFAAEAWEVTAEFYARAASYLMGPAVLSGSQVSQ